MRFHLLIGLSAVAMVMQGESSPAVAQGDDKTPVTGYGACRSFSADVITTPFPLPDGAQRRDLPRLLNHWNMNNKVNDNTNGRCMIGSLEEVQEYINSFVNPADVRYKYELVDHFKPDWSIITFRRLGSSGRRQRDIAVGPDVSKSPSDRKPPAQGPASTKYVEVTDPDGKTIRLSPEVAARNQAATDEYRRKMEEHARAKAEHDQRLAQHRQNAATATSAEEQHKREVAAAAERYAAYKVAMADHARKVAGASTNDDPNTCITRPEFRSNDGLPGNTSASVINGCPQKVDIVLCLKRTAGDWTCGARFGILPQSKMSYATLNATGEIFVDAITYGGGGKLKRPAGM